MSAKSAHKTAHLKRLRDLEARLETCQTDDAVANMQKLIDAENNRWANTQQTADDGSDN